MNGLPPCAGKWFLFDSIDINDHKEAAAICDTCPMVKACEQRRLDDIANGGQPVGTWAGTLTRPMSWRAREVRLPIHPDVEDAMFTDEEARAAEVAYRQGARDDRACIGHRVYSRRTTMSRTERNATAAEAMLAGGLTIREAARELGITHAALDKALERTRRARRERGEQVAS